MGTGLSRSRDNNNKYIVGKSYIIHRIQLLLDALLSINLIYTFIYCQYIRNNLILFLFLFFTTLSHRSRCRRDPNGLTDTAIKRRICHIIVCILTRT